MVKKDLTTPVIIHSYVIFGRSPNRFGRGSTDNSLKMMQIIFNKNRLMKLIRCTEKIEMFLDTRLLQSLSYIINQLIQYEMLKNNNGKETKIWTALSHAVNYNSPAHIDKDLFFLHVP